jgi:hypothetical protein
VSVAGNPPHDIGSGDSFVHNTSMFDHPQKSVVKAPWRYSPKPLWSSSNTNLERVTLRALAMIAGYESTPYAGFYLVRAAVNSLLG